MEPTGIRARDDRRNDDRRNDDRRNRSAPDFDRLAHVYRWMEYLSFGRALERCRFQFLPECGSARRALVLGDGDGRFTARLLATNSTVRVDAIDASPAMLAELRRRAERATPAAGARLQTICADIRGFTFEPREYDLIVSHFFFDCFTDDEVSRAIARIVPHTTPDATWILSEFAIPERGWARHGARLVVRFLYFAFHLLTGLDVKNLPDYGAALYAGGFRRRKQARRLGGLLVADLWKRD